MRRLYLQCSPDEDIEKWPDDRIWEELHRRLATDDGWKPQRTDHPKRCHRYAELRDRADAIRPAVSRGDAAHIVPPTGAKGLNLAVADVRVLARRWLNSTNPDKRELIDRIRTLACGASGKCSASPGG